MVREINDIQDLMEEIQLDALVIACKEVLIEKGFTTENELEARLKFNSQQRIRELLAQLDAERLEFECMDKNDIDEEKIKLFLKDNDEKRQYYSKALVELYK